MSMLPQPARPSRLLQLALATALLALLLACGVSRSPTATATAPLPTATLTATTAPTATAAAEATATTAVSAATSATATSVAGQALAATVTPPPAGVAPAFADVRAAVLSYLERSGGSTEGLAAAIAKWGMAPETQSGEGILPAKPAAIAADFDGDGEDEVAVVVEDPETTGIVGTAIMLIADRTAGDYEITYDSETAAYTTGAAGLIGVDDADGDAVADLSYTTVNCGAHTCFYEISVVSHHSGSYVNLSPGVSVPYPDLLAVRDEAGDERLEIVVHGGTIGSVGAGPQRTSTMIYALENGTYALAEVRYDPSDLRYFAVADANAALAAGRLDEAVALYRQAIDDRTLEASGMMLNGMTEEQEDEALRSFARFRLLVSESIRGDQEAAQAAYDEAANGGGPYAPLAEAYWDAFSVLGTAEGGCAAVTDEMAQAPELVDILNAFGYANPYFVAEDVCRGSGTPQ
ncbi:MAG: hypothetical protein ACYC5O_09420 [Anaerolineae bacterium]